MMAGYGGQPAEGKLTLAVNEALFPLAVTFTVMLVLVTVPVTVGGGGLVPRAYISACLRISSRRQVQSALAVISVPSSFLNGSGSRAIDGSPVAPGSAVTVQLAPSSSDVEMNEGPVPMPASRQLTAIPPAPPLPPPPASVLPPVALPPVPGLPGFAPLPQARMARQAAKASRPEKDRRSVM